MNLQWCGVGAAAAWMLLLCLLSTGVAAGTEAFAPVVIDVVEDVDADGDGRGDHGRIGRMPKGIDHFTVTTFTFQETGRQYRLVFSESRSGGERVNVQFGSHAPSAGWFAYGMLDVVLGNQSMWTGRVTATVSNDPIPAIEIVSEHDAGRVQLRLSMLKGDDRLLGRVTIAPKDRPAGGMLMLSCYPGDYARTASDRARYIATAERHIDRDSLPGDQWIDLQPTEHWLLIGDHTYNPGTGRGVGPSAVAWESAHRATVHLTTYLVQPRIVFVGREFHFVLWETNHPGRDEAVERLRMLNPRSGSATEE
jgi:hypothetical protein